MKKIAIILCAFLISSVSLFTFNASAKSDQNYQQFTFNDGVKGNTYNWLTYTDTKCGMNTIAHFSAVTTKKISRMEVDWTAYNITGTEQFWGNKPLVNTNYLLDTSRKGVIGKSFAQFLLKHGKQTWKPKGYAYHCGTGSIKSINKDSVDTSAKNAVNTLENSPVLPAQYSEINNINFDDQSKVVKDTFKEYYNADLNLYTFKNGQRVNADDLKIIETKNELGTKFEDESLGLKVAEENISDFSYVEVEIPETVFDENNKEFMLKGYIVTSKSTQDKLDFGLIETEIE
ncbi:hypothetical protein [Rummeliibacillus suwonensis]|uniref:hypothetical protein n=1 Tax=Rummeliibacillus suwonensis TaxID=1306154 RepID=UPI00289B2E22|nr:hypothetical protein [Rummeliibacillus suwonensis]